MAFLSLVDISFSITLSFFLSSSAIRVGYKSNITIINEFSGTSVASEQFNLFIIVIYDLLPTYSFLLSFPLEIVADLLNDLLNRYYKICN